MLESVRAFYLGESSNLIYSIYGIGEPFAGRARERVLTLYERKLEFQHLLHLGSYQVEHQ